MRPYLAQPYDHLLFSYHGVPARHIKKSDVTGGHCLQKENCCEVPSPAHEFCYRHQVITTTKAVTGQLQIPATSGTIKQRKSWILSEALKSL